jgi:hypothetical protein
MTRLVSLLILACILVGPCGPMLRGQNVDLAKLQKEEAERRKKTPKAKIRYVDTALPTPQKEEAKPGVSAEAKPAPAARPAASDPYTEDENKKRNYWQSLKKEIDTKIQALQAAVERDQSETNRLQTAYYNNVALNQAQVKDQFETIKAQLQKEKDELKAAEAERDSLLERARKEGVPPGWLR